MTSVVSVDAVSTVSVDSRTTMDGAFVDVSPLDDIPQPWRTAMENAGFYSLRDLATKADLGTSTASALIYGRKASSERTMQVVADSLRLPVTTIREWASVARGEREPFVLPAEANRLTQKDREAVLAVVRQLAAAHAQNEPEPPDPGQPDLSVAEGIRLSETQPLRVVPEHGNSK